MLQELMASGVVAIEDWETLSAGTRGTLSRTSQGDLLLSLIVEHGLLTEYQAGEVALGKAANLVLNNYRILDRLGGGRLGIVYKAEHTHLRRLVALKLVNLPAHQAQRALPDYFSEMRTLAHLSHPHIVSTLDAGEVLSPHPGDSVLHYLVTEYLPGHDLADYVTTHGPLSVPFACALVYQVAGALAEAHQRQLVHGDIKPTNIRVTGEGQAKLLDFGMARHLGRGNSEKGNLADDDYVAPEQVHGKAPDVRSDTYALGRVLRLCLTAQQPSRQARATTIPVRLEAVIARMTAPKRDNRFHTPQGVMNALLPFLGSGPDPRGPTTGASALGISGALAHVGTPAPVAQRVLIVDDDMDIRSLCRFVLEPHNIKCDEAGDGLHALQMIGSNKYDLVLLDMALPGMSGQEVCQKLRQKPPTANLKIVLFSGHLVSDDLAQLLAAGADDYVTKPFSVVQFLARIKAALRLKEAQDRADRLSNHLLGANHQLEQNLNVRDQELVEAHKALVLALAKLVECRDSETGTHLKRLQSYCRVLAEEAALVPAFAGSIDPDFIRWLEWCAPLHDIGKAGIPDRILRKEGALTPDERTVMQRHTILGADTLKEVARQHGSGMAFLQMAIDVARHHHERFDGTGYPDQLAGNAIPLAARLLAIADVYDALRSRRVYKPALPHTVAMNIIVQGSPGQFDPALLQAFQRCAGDLDRIFTEWSD
jgi:response regulator RpfG family c-di-GMP phosphodiesterase